MAQDIGIITEQGDLGFGFDKLNEKDEKVYNEAVKRQNGEDNKQVINESNK
jgi:hypothetical protein